MDRLVLAFWILVGALGLFGTTYRAAPISAGASIQPLDGGLIPPMRPR
jgi:hypothetical protein